MSWLSGSGNVPPEEPLEAGLCGTRGKACPYFMGSAPLSPATGAGPEAYASLPDWCFRPVLSIFSRTIVNFYLLKIRYFPWREFILFAAAISGLIVLLVSEKISLWFLIPAVILVYPSIMCYASVIILDVDKLKIISINPLVGSHSIPLKSILKINSNQSLHDDPYETAGAPHLTMSRWYQLEYINSHGKNVKVVFSFSNDKKETLIMEKLKLITQGF